MHLQTGDVNIERQTPSLTVSLAEPRHLEIRSLCLEWLRQWAPSALAASQAPVIFAPTTIANWHSNKMSENNYSSTVTRIVLHKKALEGFRFPVGFQFFDSGQLFLIVDFFG